MNCPSNGEIELFIQPVAVTPRLRIYGDTPVARAVAWLAREADFEPTTDAEATAAEATALATGIPAPGDRPGPTPVVPTPPPSPDSYALIATQGDGDESALESALRSPARAVLVVASKRKAERLRAAMTLRGIPESRLAAMRAPAGPNIGAVTPNEIALAAIAGLVALRRGQPMEGGKRPESRPANTPNASNATGYVNPVCGAVIDPTRALSTLTMGGQTHYFCCQGCRVEFERDPEKYLAIAAHMRAPATL
jgi:xanthine dehydrogenase accessory factor